MQRLFYVFIIGGLFGCQKKQEASLQIDRNPVTTFEATNLKLYIGTAHAVPVSGQGDFANVKGILVNAISCATSEQDYNQSVADKLKFYNLELLEMTDIEEFGIKETYWSKNKEFESLINRVKMNHSTELDTFHTYDRYDGDE